MPTVECYKDIGALGARLDEMEKSRLEREEERDRQRRARDEDLAKRLDSFDGRLDKIKDQLDTHEATRNQLQGMIWAIRIIFGGVGVLIVYLVKDGFPEWFKLLFR